VSGHVRKKQQIRKPVVGHGEAALREGFDGVPEMIGDDKAPVGSRQEEQVGGGVDRPVQEKAEACLAAVLQADQRSLLDAPGNAGPVRIGIGQVDSICGRFEEKIPWRREGPPPAWVFFPKAAGLWVCPEKTDQCPSPLWFR
jgi:hypothetical protein